MTARPTLDLGPMTGTPEYIKERSEALVRAFAGLLDVPEIKLIDSSPQGGKTDCSSTIWIPMQDPEGYLVCEHELSHWLFETDVILVSKYLDLLVGKLLNNAGIKLKTDQAIPYEKHLKGVIHGLWNILEDHRCCWLWSQLYRGGGALLEQRWHDICEYDYPPEASKKNLVTCLSALAAGVDVPDVPKDFEDCKPAMRRAMRLVAGVDAVACMAITTRLVNEILDALLNNNPVPPPPPPVPNSGSGGGPGNPGKQQTPGQQAMQQRQQQATRAQQEAQHLLKLLGGVVPRMGPHQSQPGGGGIGTPDVAEPPKESKDTKQRARSEGALGKIQALAQADDSESDESGQTPLQRMMTQGADAMEGRLEEARQAMARNQEDGESTSKQLCLGWSQEMGIPIVNVRATRDLPEPTEVAHENRRILEQLRMKKRKKRDYEGDFITDRFLAALGQGDVDVPFYDKMTKVARFELLFLFDLSGSMTIGQALPLTERALADSVFAVKAIHSKAHMWGFSDHLYMYEEPGSPMNTAGVSHGSTMMVQALDVAHQWGRKAPDKRALMLVTDGWPTSCRAKGSRGHPLDDLSDVLGEIRRDKIPLTVLGIRHAGMDDASTKTMYDRAFGESNYGVVGTFDDLARELPRAVRVMAEAHVMKGARRS